jgi:transcriptional regulator with XRE-family HTH domain
MKIQEAVSKRIFELCSERNITINALSRLSAIPPSTLKNIIYNVSKNPGIVTIKIICDGLGISINDFFDSDIFRNLEQEIE